MKVTTYVTIGPGRSEWTVVHKGKMVAFGNSPYAYIEAMNACDELGLEAEAVISCHYDGPRYHLMARTLSGFYETRAYGTSLIVRVGQDGSHTLEVRE